MATLTISMGDRLTFDGLWRTWIDKTRRTDFFPPQAGPDPQGRLTLVMVPEEFVDELRTNNFPFEVI